MKIRAVNNFLLTVPEDSGQRLAIWRSEAGLTQEDLSRKLGLTRRFSISEYEHGTIPMTDIVYSLSAIILNKHPSKPKNVRLDNKELVFNTCPMDVDFSYLISKYIKTKSVSINEISDSTSIDINALQDFIDGNKKPNLRQWTSIQLALDMYASGFSYSQQLIAARAKLNISQAEAGRVSGLVTQSISNFETRKTIPSSQTWTALMLALNFHPTLKLNKGRIPSSSISGLN